MEYREFANLVKDMVRSLGENFTEPDEDWVAAAALETNNGDLHMLMLAVPPERIPGVVVESIRRFRARKVATIISTWAVKGRIPAPDEDLSEAPDRTEQVVVCVFDAERTEMWRATIDRDGVNPPRLAPWSPEGPVLGTYGPLVDPIQEALR